MKKLIGVVLVLVGLWAVFLRQEAVQLGPGVFAPDDPKQEHMDAARRKVQRAFPRRGDADAATPLKQARGPETIASVIAMLASEDGAHINGEEIRVDFVEHLRAIEPFTTIAALVEQIRADVERARAVVEGG